MVEIYGNRILNKFGMRFAHCSAGDSEVRKKPTWTPY
jgi:hypothetical protein